MGLKGPSSDHHGGLADLLHDEPKGEGVLAAQSHRHMDALSAVAFCIDEQDVTGLAGPIGNDVDFQAVQAKFQARLALAASSAEPPPSPPSPATGTDQQLPQPQQTKPEELPPLPRNPPPQPSLTTIESAPSNEAQMVAPTVITTAASFEAQGDETAASAPPTIAPPPLRPPRPPRRHHARNQRVVRQPQRTSPEPSQLQQHARQCGCISWPMDVRSPTPQCRHPSNRMDPP